jgi:hypothetical protein
VGEASPTDVVDAVTVETEIGEEDGITVVEGETMAEIVEVLLFKLGY